MSALYIHIPFCRKACTYCNFHFSTTLHRKPEMVDAICKEIKLQKDFLNGSVLNSIYFGGGTPSVLDKEELNKIFENIYRNFSVASDAEITLEANPDDLHISKIKELSQTPVNRLSVGIQSFRDEDLVLMNRSHNAQQAELCIIDAQHAGFQNISLDLIFAIPGMDDNVWREQIEKAVSLGVPHISSYALTVEEKTVLHHQIIKKEIEEVDEDTAARQFEILWKDLIDAGFEHYEISNFAVPGKRAVHNSAYWSGDAYLGVGPAAHSFKKNLRRWNVSNNIKYLQSIKNGEVPFDQEILQAKDVYNELVMTALRRMEGLDMRKISDMGESFSSYFFKEAKLLLASGKLIKENGFIKIPQQWRFHSDGIASALFYI